MSSLNRKREKVEGKIQNPIRIQRKRTKGFKTPEGTIYVGRPTKFGNPFKLTPDGMIMCYSTNRSVLNPWIVFNDGLGHTVEDIVELYELWIKGRMLDFEYLPIPPNTDELEGKNLSCFCSLNTACHADVLLTISNKI